MKKYPTQNPLTELTLFERSLRGYHRPEGFPPNIWIESHNEFGCPTWRAWPVFGAEAALKFVMKVNLIYGEAVLRRSPPGMGKELCDD